MSMIWAKGNTNVNNKRLPTRRPPKRIPYLKPRYRNTAIDGPTASTKKPSSYNPVIIIQIAKIIQIMILVC